VYSVYGLHKSEKIYLQFISTIKYIFLVHIEGNYVGSIIVQPYNERPKTLVRLELGTKVKKGAIAYKVFTISYKKTLGYPRK